MKHIYKNMKSNKPTNFSEVFLFAVVVTWGQYDYHTVNYTDSA